MNTAGSVVAFQGGTWSNTQAGTVKTSLVSTVPSSVIVGASIFGLAPVNVTNTVTVDATGEGDVPVTLDGEAVVLGTGTAQIGNVSGSVISRNIIPSSLLTGASIIGRPPIAVTNIPSVSGTINVGNHPTNQNISGSVASFQRGTRIVSVVGTRAGTASVYAVLASITTVSVLNANTNRKGATVYNTAGTDVYIKLGTAATTSVYTVLLNNDDYYELPSGWTGVVAGIAASNAGRINVTELT